jgi:ElaB/YqjD/DUF883 family membrane-anchored ribosome-binding protein
MTPLPKPLQRELEHQLKEIAYLGRLTQQATTQNSENLRHVAREVRRGLDAVDSALKHSPSLTTEQKRELLAQVDQTLANNRALLSSAHARNLARVQTASLPRPRQASALADFIEGATFGLVKKEGS